MKKQLLFLIPLMVVLVEQTSASWSTQFFYQCGISKKYRATAKIRPPGQNSYSFVTDKGCTFAEQILTSFAVNNQSDKAYSWARCDNSNKNQRQGWSTTGWSWGEPWNGLTKNISFAPMINLKRKLVNEADCITSAALDDDGVNFNNSEKKISISNLTGNLRIVSNDLANDYTTFQIRVFTYNAPDENTVEEVTLLWSAKASILYGELVLEGNFSTTDFSTVEESSGIREYSIQNISKLISLSSNINMEDVCVEISGDGGNLGEGLSEKFAPGLSTEVMTKFENKVASSTNLNFSIAEENSTKYLVLTKNENNLTTSTVNVMDINGKILISIQKPEFTRNRLDLKTNDLPSGIYFAILINNDGTFTKKFVK